MLREPPLGLSLSSMPWLAKLEPGPVLGAPCSSPAAGASTQSAASSSVSIESASFRAAAAAGATATEVGVFPAGVRGDAGALSSRSAKCWKRLTLFAAPAARPKPDVPTMAPRAAS